MEIEKLDPETPEALRARVRELLAHAARGDTAQHRVARSELERLHSRTSLRSIEKAAFTKEFSNELVAGYQKYTTDCERAQYLSGLVRVVYAMRHDTHETADLVCEVIESKSTAVRQAALRLARRVSMKWYLHTRDEAQVEEWHRVYALRVRSLIEKHAPREWRTRSPFDPVVVPKLHASVLKSLLMLWHEWTHIGVSNDIPFEERHPECAVPFPLDWFDESFDEESEEESLSPAEVAEEMLGTSPYPEESLRALTALQAAAQQDFAAFQKKYPVTLPFVSQERTFADEVTEHTRVTMQKNLETIHRAGGRLEDVGEYLRLSHRYILHHIHRTQNSHAYSELCLVLPEDLTKPHRARYHEAPVLLMHAHDALHRLHQELVRHLTKECDELAAFNPERACRHLEEHTARLQELVAIAQYVLDVYLFLTPTDFFKKTPEKLAAIALHGAWRINVDELPHPRYVLLNRDVVAAFGGWKGSPGNIALFLVSDIRSSTPGLLPFALHADRANGERYLKPRDFERDEEEDEYEATLDNGRGSAHDDHAHHTGGPPADVLGTPFTRLNEKEFEMRLAVLFERHGLNGMEGVRSVKALVYDADDGKPKYMQRYHDAFHSLFEDSKHAMDERTMFELLATATDAWNVFPHRSLSGKSPNDMMREYLKKEGGA